MLVGALGAAVATGSAHAQSPIEPQPPGKTQPQPFPTSTPAKPGAPPPAQVTPASPAQPQQPGQPQPGQPQPGQPTSIGIAPLTETLTPTPQSTPTMPATWTPLPTHTVTNTPTVTPFPAFLPRVTPTLAWPTPGPSAFFVSRYLATSMDPLIPLGGSGVLRGRVVDWRGIGLNNFRVQATGPRGQVETFTTADGQYTMVNMAPGEYDVGLPDYQGEQARAIPIVALSATALDWVEASRNQAPATVVATTATPAPTRSPTPLEIQRAPTTAARPPPFQIEVTDIANRALEQLVNAFLTGIAIVSLTAVVVIGLTRRRR